VCYLDYGGWKWQEPDLTQLPAGIKLQMTGLRITRGSGILSGSGSIFLNNLSYQAGSTDLENTEAEAKVRKVIIGDQVYIFRDGVRYTVLGTEVK
jgi:hypothetical protein